MPTRIIIKKLRTPTLTNETQEQLLLSTNNTTTTAAVGSSPDEYISTNDGELSQQQHQRLEPPCIDTADKEDAQNEDMNAIVTPTTKGKDTGIRPAIAAKPIPAKRQRSTILPTFGSSSLLRELNVRTVDNDDDNDDNDVLRRPNRTNRSYNHEYNSTEPSPSTNVPNRTMERYSPSSRSPQSNNGSKNTTQMISDIRGSPRIIGYLFNTIASAVMLVSVVQFYRQRNIVTATESIEDDEYYYFFNGIVVKWKLWGAIYASSIGAGISLCIIYVHFDTMIAPELWHYYFRNGSIIEQCIIIFLIIYWAGAVHVCTSTLSVGESQANVYFATWIAFGASAMNYGVWCESAVAVRSMTNTTSTTTNTNTITDSNRVPDSTTSNTMNRSGGEDYDQNDDEDVSIHSPRSKSKFVFFDNLLHGNYNHISSQYINSNNAITEQHRHRDSTHTSTRVENDKSNKKEAMDLNYRETTYNWVWVGFFSCIFAGSATDLYWNRDDIRLRFKGDDLNLVHSDWIIILSVVWSEVALCGMAIFLNTQQHLIKSTCSCRLPLFLIRNSNTANDNINESNKRYRCIFGWRQIEGLVILFTTGLKFWVILRYASVDGVIRGLSNAYFGVWGSFFNGVFCFGTWIRENKNFEYIVHD